MLVNGYTKTHKKLKNYLSKINGFEDGVIVGSGFLANISMIEALVRDDTVLIMDSYYHASGVLANSFVNNSLYFEHNNPNDLKIKLKKYKNTNTVVAIEGVYSMSGEIAKKEIFDICDEFGAILIVDEAHSSGVIGKNLLGIFDYYNIKPNINHIKMGTLGKAYGSYGAYILASKNIISFLQNRAKPIIYSTSLSIFDTLLAYNSIKYIQKHRKKYYKKILQKQELSAKYIKKIDSLILSIETKSNKDVLKLKKNIIQHGFIVGAIRQPTVSKPIIRVILRVNISNKKIKKLINYLTFSKQSI